MDVINKLSTKAYVSMIFAISNLISCKEDRKKDSGQGTTEYAILVGVLVVIAILAVALFRDKLQELWDSIADGINSL